MHINVFTYKSAKSLKIVFLSHLLQRAGGEVRGAKDPEEGVCPWPVECGHYHAWRPRQGPRGPG